MSRRGIPLVVIVLQRDPPTLELSKVDASVAIIVDLRKGSECVCIIEFQTETPDQVGELGDVNEIVSIGIGGFKLAPQEGMIRERHFESLQIETGMGADQNGKYSETDQCQARIQTPGQKEDGNVHCSGKDVETPSSPQQSQNVEVPCEHCPGSCSDIHGIPCSEGSKFENQNDTAQN